jgi:hypothetical protein
LSAWALLLAVLVRWPLSVNLDAMPLDPNSPLHILALEQIASGGNWVEISNLAFPTPVPIRMVAIPTLLLGIPFAQVMSPMAALNVATTLMVALQGIAVAALVATLRWGRTAQYVAATAAIACTYTVHVQSLGQQENLGFVAMALAVWSSCQQGRVAWVGSILALAIAAFSSPYQAVPTGILLVCTSWCQNREALLRSLASSAIVAVPVLLYYTGATDGASSIPGITTSPPEEGYLASAGLLDMVHPRAMWDGGPSDVPSIADRFSSLTTSISTTTFHSGWPWITAHQTAYLGLVLLLGGLGLYSGRAGQLHKGLIAGAALSLIFALGPQLRLVSESSTGLPLPWSAFALLPGLSDLQATHRFLSGLIFALILGLAYSMRNAGRPKGLLLVGLLLAEGLLRAPVHWPLPTARGELDAVVEKLPEGPVMLWPPLNHFAPQYFEMLAVLLERPVGIYTPSGVTLNGEIRYEGNRMGHIRMDIVRETNSRDFPMEVVHATTLDRLGRFEIDVEVDLGKVDIIVFLDQEGNGPDAYEPLATLKNIRVGLQDVHDLEFQLTDPAITRDEVERSRDEPIRPGTHLPEDLPQKKGNLSPSDWLLRGAQGGARAVLRTQSRLSQDGSGQDLGFEVGSNMLRIGLEECITEQHCVQLLTMPGHRGRPPQR